MSKLPSSFYSAIGALGVSTKPVVGSGKEMGMAHYDTRHIEVSSDMTEDMQLLVFLHETVHFALFDAGAHNVLTKKQKEVVCDAVALFLFGAIKAGYLKVQVPK